jgi:hypothetical protein
MTIPTLSGRSFAVGRYLVVATPITGSAQMLRYTVFLDGRRIGANVSLPSEADCNALAQPPADLPLPVAWRADYRRSGPK